MTGYERIHWLYERLKRKRFPSRRDFLDTFPTRLQTGKSNSSKMQMKFSRKTLLAHDVRSALESVGLDPAVGFLHRDRPGRPSLALDLMEELRPVLADRLALSLVNRQQIKGNGFKTTETGAVVMDDAARKELLVAYQKRKQEEVQHPFINEKVALGLLPFVQAQLLSRYLRGDLDGYPPYCWK